MPGNKKAKGKGNKVLRIGDRVADPKHFKYVTHYRVNVMKVMKAIRDGEVDEGDLDRLQNFLQMSISLMERTPLKIIQSVWRDTEIFAHLENEETFVNPDTTILPAILDAAKQNPNREQRRAQGVINDRQEHFAGRPKDHIDQWVDEEFTKFERLDTVDQQTVKNAASFAQGLDEIKYDQILAGNAANTMELHHLINDLQGVVPDKRGRYIHDNMEYALLGFLWHGKKVVVCDDLIGVFVSRNTAREIYKTYHERIENESTNP